MTFRHSIALAGLVAVVWAGPAWSRIAPLAMAQQDALARAHAHARAFSPATELPAWEPARPAADNLNALIRSLTASSSRGALLLRMLEAAAVGEPGAAHRAAEGSLAIYTAMLAAYDAATSAVPARFRSTFLRAVDADVRAFRCLALSAQFRAWEERPQRDAPVWLCVHSEQEIASCVADPRARLTPGITQLRTASCPHTD